MTDEIQVTHRHPDRDHEMSTIEEDRIDGLHVRQLTCECGFGAAVLSRDDEREPGASWPFRFGSRGQLS